MDNRLQLLCRLARIEPVDPHREKKYCMIGPFIGGCVFAIPQQAEGLWFETRLQADPPQQKMRRDSVWNCRGDLVDPPRANA